MKRLVSNGALYSSNPDSFSKFTVLKARDDFHKRIGQNTTQSRGVIEGDFAMAITLYHAYELLIQHGMRSFYHFLKSTMDGTKGQSRARAELAGNPTFHEIMDELKEKFDPYGTSRVSPSKFMSSTQRGQRSKLLSSYGASQAKAECMKSPICSHPKLEKLVEVVLEHFRKVGSQEVGGGMGSRVMIFSQYRESVHEIADVLSVHSPTVRVMTFVGQSSAGKSSRGLTQREQLQVVQRFRQGGYNTLVATCVGEEGLDIGEVDLIVCFDVHASPIRLVQRLGRTGRKRDGRIVVLVTEGKEENVRDTDDWSNRQTDRDSARHMLTYLLLCRFSREVRRARKALIKPLMMLVGHSNSTPVIHGWYLITSTRNPARRKWQLLTTLIHTNRGKAEADQPATQSNSVCQIGEERVNWVSSLMVSCAIGVTTSCCHRKISIDYLRLWKMCFQ